MKIKLTKDVQIGAIQRKKGQVLDVDKETYHYLKGIMPGEKDQNPYGLKFKAEKPKTKKNINK